MDSNRIGAFVSLVEDRASAALGNVSAHEAAVLSAIRFRPGVIAHALHGILGLSQPAVARLLRGLENRGLVRRGPARGRTVPLGLTEAGEATVERVLEARRAAMEQLVAPLAPEEQAQLADLMDKMLAGALRSRAHGRHLCRLCDYDQCSAAGCPVEARVDEIDGGVDWRNEFSK